MIQSKASSVPLVKPVKTSSVYKTHWRVDVTQIALVVVVNTVTQVLALRENVIRPRRVRMAPSVSITNV